MAKQATERLISQSEFGRLTQMTRQNINILCKTRLAPAVMLVGSRRNLDLNHIVIKEYLEERLSKNKAIQDPFLIVAPPEVAKKKTKPKAKKKTPQISAEISRTTIAKTPLLDEIANLTIREVVERWGGIAGFKLYVDALKGMADWKNRELKYRKERAQVVEVEPFAASLFALVDLAFKRIAGEFPQAMAPQLKAIVMAGKDDDIIKMIALMEKELTQTIRDCKSKITKDLKRKKKESAINY